MIALPPFSFWRSLTQTPKGSGTGQRETLLEKFTDFPAVQKFQPPLRAHQAMLPLCSPWGEQSYRRNLQRDALTNSVEFLPEVEMKEISP